MSVRVAKTTIIKRALGAFAAFAAISVLWAGVIRADENDHVSYPELGMTTSGPSIGYWWGRPGLRVTGMYVDKDHCEFHLNLGYAFSDSAKVQQSLNLLTSWVTGSDPGGDYRYGWGDWFDEM